ncbi:carboxypeptidase-like regulatory domain-containing protein [bacterium]|nr:carboxypeptidase-like regulatory domain-containing protein [bacterium]
MKKKPLLFIIFGIVILLLISIYFYVSTGLHIEATVYDSVEEKPLAQATVRIDEKSYFTDNQGYFQSNVPLFGSHKLVIEKNGYKTYSAILNYQTIQKSNKLIVTLEPITFANILRMAQKDLQSAKSYSFRSTWVSNQGEEEETVAYSLYEISSEGAMHFKWLQDDKAGSLIATREMIKTKEFLFYRDKENAQWQKIDEEKIPPVKLQEPTDILNLFQGTEDPSSFLYVSLDTLFEDPAGRLFLQNELPSQTTDEQGEEIKYKEIKVLKYQASWNVLSGKRDILLFVGEENLRLYKGILTDISQPANTLTDSGKMTKTILSFTLTKLNEEIQITIPEV